ncbi:MAG TPA: SemiSWEET family transporter [Anaerolineales bacterium]|nr:SemiSWEET family transporter [Anaerolineales bacterium]
MELTQILSWIGTSTGMLIGIPQLIKTIKTKKASDLSATTFILILITCSCLLVRAIAIQELAFIFYYTFLILINSLQLSLIWKYKDQSTTI